MDTKGFAGFKRGGGTKKRKLKDVSTNFGNSNIGPNKKKKKYNKKAAKK